MRKPIPANRNAIHDARRRNSKLEELEYRLIMSESHSPSTIPRLVAYRNDKRIPIRVKSKYGGTEIGDVPLFTFAKKMNCPSFSMPAGNPKIGGTCWMEGSPAQSYICHWCYALKGNYLQYPANQVRQMIRLIWVDRQLKNGTFVQKMTEAMENLYGKNLSSIGEDAQRFFRLHDSGDFHTVNYFYGWMDVIRNFPEISFWCPTRVWAHPDFKNVIAQTLPRNLNLRYSALHMDEYPPNNNGSTAHTFAGSALISPNGKKEKVGVTEKAQVRGKAIFVKVEGQWVFECPAYRYHTDKDKANSDSCEGSENIGIQVGANRGCRFCWVSKNHPVSYKEH